MVAHPSPDLGPLPWWSPHRPSGRGKVVWIGTCGRETFAPMRLLAHGWPLRIQVRAASSRIAYHR